MWCSNCQQDVPGIVSNHREAQYRCARCQAPLPSSCSKAEAEVDEAIDTDEFMPDTKSSTHNPTTSDPHQAPVPLDHWRLDEELRAAERLTRRYLPSPSIDSSEDEISQPMFDTTHLRVPEGHVHRHLAEPPAVSHAAEPKLPRRSNFFAWCMVSLGLMTFVCGGVLLGWGFISERGDLWQIGMPLTLAGQAALIVGLVLQLDGLWQSNRETNGTLDELDGQLHDLRHATTMLSTTHSSSAQSFYAHMAEGASPDLLLADLKGQMDMLAVRMAKERR